ncbi:MAG: glycosyltransferase [Pseudonocardiales bacterium]|nr:glycosyltransferase [Pseudonocardiales bacterium]MBV9029019.1 glycosyltransferase [Pseudonocardiales bacterium]
MRNQASTYNLLLVNGCARGPLSRRIASDAAGYPRTEGGPSVGERALPKVSVIVVNYRGAEHTVVCLRALRDELDWPTEALELICVDNASGDGGARRIAAAVPQARLVRSATNLGFAGGCNLGAGVATGSVVAFLNSDARPHRDWVRAAVETLGELPDVAAVASKVLDWDGERIDYVDGGLTWYGMGYKPHVGKPDDGAHDTARDVLFGTGAALLVRREAFERLGGFDERFFMFCEDVDLGWRLNLRGYRVRYEPRSIAYHRHHASLRGADPARETYLLERNALATLYKNVSEETLATVLPAALALAVRRATARGECDPTELEMTRRSPDAETPGPMAVPRVTMAGIYAIDRFVEMLPTLTASRRAEQTARVRTDADLLPLMRNALERTSPEIPYLLAHETIVEALGVARVYGARRRVLIITADAVSQRMAGPAIRAWNMAEVLSGEHDVRLVSLNQLCSPTPAEFEVRHATSRSIGPELDWAQLVVLQGHVLEQIPSLKTSQHIVIVDIYDPMHLEQLEQARDLGDEARAEVVEAVTAVLTTQLRRGDFFLCASERQRHFWLGHLAAIGRLSPAVYDADPTTRSLLAVAPFGLSGKPPQRTGPGLRETLGLRLRDKVVLWAGGVYSWFDPLTLLHAVHAVRAEHPELRLVFLGMRHPNPDVPEMGMAGQARRLAESLGLTGEQVFFNETWVPYTDRQNWLLDADAGVTTHFEHVETTFAFRTRVLDYLWAGLPIVTTSGDAFAELVGTEELGVVVPAGDPAALAAALARVLYDDAFAAGCRDRVAAVAQRFTWDAALAPLVEFCRHPRLAPDRSRGAPLTAPGRRAGVTGALRRDAALARSYLTAGGPGEVARRAAGRLQRLWITREWRSER